MLNGTFSHAAQGFNELFLPSILVQNPGVSLFLMSTTYSSRNKPWLTYLMKTYFSLILLDWRQTRMFPRIRIRIRILTTQSPLGAFFILTSVVRPALSFSHASSNSPFVTRSSLDHRSKTPTAHLDPWNNKHADGPTQPFRSYCRLALLP